MRKSASLGFRKWYERRLAEAFAWLVTALLCALVAALCIELIDFGSRLLTWSGTAAAVYVAGLIVLHAMRRFLALLAEAERYGSQSTCGSCGCKALEVTAEAPRMAVRCRHCGREWTLR